MYPTTDTFITGAAGGAFNAPPSITYSTAGITTPLARNLYVSSGSAYVATTVSVITGFGSSSAGPTLSAQNSYNTGTVTFNPNVTILYKTGVSNQIEETSMSINASVGTGRLYGGIPTSIIVTSILSSTSITYTVTGGSTPQSGTITNITTLGATDITANGGGITLKGTTDKTLVWDQTNTTKKGRKTKLGRLPQEWRKIYG